MSSDAQGGGPATSRGELRWLWLTLAVIVLDQLSKRWIERRFQLFEARAVLPVFNLTRLHNTGAAFSLLADASGWQRWAFTLLAMVVSLALIQWLRRLRSAPWLAAAVALILGGALGNVIDRLRLGSVIDFIQVHWGEHYFPSFNVADSAICIGAGLLILDTLLAGRRHTHPSQHNA
ncbi:MAG: signal peptidase II [Steroidobacterales bacterium]